MSGAFPRRMLRFPHAPRTALRHGWSAGIVKKISGFTLIELLIALALFLALGVSITVFSAKSVGEHAVADAADFLAGGLDEARRGSRLGRGAEPWGVRVGDGSITIFRGAGYAARNPSFDRSYRFNPNVSIAGPGEIVFSRVTGFPSTPGTFAVSWRGNWRTVVVNGLGIVER